MRDNHLPVNSWMLKQKALEIKDDSGSEFNASNGWLEGFLKRNRITNRKRTHIIQKLKSDYGKNVLNYFKQIDEIQLKYGENIIYVNFDETPITYDLCKDKTLHYQGEKEISLVSHPGAKHRFSLCPAIASNGEILDTLVIFYYVYQNKKKTGEKRQFPKKAEGFKFNLSPLMVRFNGSGYNNEELMCEWFDKLFVRFFAKHQNKHIALVIDDASFHTSEKLKKKCQENQISLLIIPGGTTSFLQPLDVSINKPIKDHLRSCYIPWLTEKCLSLGENDCTKGGYLRAPSNDLILEWVKKSLNLLEPEMLKKSFQKTGITSIFERQLIVERKKELMHEFLSSLYIHLLL